MLVPLRPPNAFAWWQEIHGSVAHLIDGPSRALLWEQPKTLCGSIINTEMDRNEELLALSIHHGALIISLSCIIMASRSIGYPHLICHSGGDEQISCGCPPRKDPRSCCMHAEPGTCNKGVTLRAATGRAGRPCSLIMYLGPAGPGTRTYVLVGEPQGPSHSQEGGNIP